MTATSNRRELWSRSGEDDCVWTEFEDGFVVFHRRSGKTHLLNDASHRLMTELLAEPRSLESIASAFDPEPGKLGSKDYHERLRSMLVRLEQLGLVRRP